MTQAIFERIRVANNRWLTRVANPIIRLAWGRSGHSGGPFSCGRFVENAPSGTSVASANYSLRANSLHKSCMHYDRPITHESIERFRRKAEECRWKASIEFDPVLKREIELTAVAYERMAERAERFLSGS
jgi:hypothetical protein